MHCRMYAASPAAQYSRFDKPGKRGGLRRTSDSSSRLESLAVKVEPKFCWHKHFWTVISFFQNRTCAEEKTVRRKRTSPPKETHAHQPLTTKGVSGHRLDSIYANEAHLWPLPYISALPNTLSPSESQGTMYSKLTRLSQNVCPISIARLNTFRLSSSSAVPYVLLSPCATFV